MAAKRCTRPSCSLTGITVSTTLSACLGCGDALAPSIDLSGFEKVFGERLRDVFPAF